MHSTCLSIIQRASFAGFDWRVWVPCRFTENALYVTEVSEGYSGLLRRNSSNLIYGNKSGKQVTGTQTADANRFFSRAVNRWQLASRSRTADYRRIQLQWRRYPYPRPQPPHGNVQVKSELQLPTPPPPTPTSLPLIPPVPSVAYLPLRFCTCAVQTYVLPGPCWSSFPRSLHTHGHAR